MRSMSTAFLAGSSTTRNSGAERFQLVRHTLDQVFNPKQIEYESASTKRYRKSLDRAVRGGHLSKSQEEQLLSKRHELRQFVSALLTSRREERNQAIRTKWQEMVRWAHETNIPTRYLGYQLRQQSP